ncbi:MAG: crotonase/enoyl-CoA hydratase family protein [Hyphomicrobiales bacterium]
MKAYNTIELCVDERQVATLTLNRPDKHNAMNAQMIAELNDAANWLASQNAIRAVILAANGKNFCAGGDLEWMQDQATKDRAGKMAESKALATMLHSLNTLPKPLIGRIQGAAFGGGIGLISVCDTSIAVTGAQFCLTETKLGLIPATVGPFVVKRMGEGFARQVFFNGKLFNTEFAIRSGLVSKTCQSEDLDQAIASEIKSLISCAPGAVAAAKSLCLEIEQLPPEKVADITASALADRWETEEAKLGISAFFERRSPPWKS